MSGTYFLTFSISPVPKKHEESGTHYKQFTHQHHHRHWISTRIYIATTNTHICRALPRKTSLTRLTRNSRWGTSSGQKELVTWFKRHASLLVTVSGLSQGCIVVESPAILTLFLCWYLVTVTASGNN